MPCILAPSARVSARSSSTTADIFFGLAAMGGAFPAGRVAHLFPAAMVLLAFSLMMVATAIAMLRTPAPRATAHIASRAELPMLKVLREGSVVGAITGVVGAGGAFLVVPALVLLGGLPMELAVTRKSSKRCTSASTRVVVKSRTRDATARPISVSALGL